MTINSGNDANAGSGDTPTKTTLQVTMSTDAGLQIVTTTTPVTTSTIDGIDSSQPILQKAPPLEKLSHQSPQPTLTACIQSNHHHESQAHKHHSPAPPKQTLTKVNSQSARVLPELIAVPITPPPRTPTSANCKVVGFNDNAQHFALPAVDNCVDSPIADDWKAALARDITEYGRQFDREIARHSSSCTSASSSRPESRTSGGGQLSRASTSASSHSHASASGNARAMRKSPTQCSSGGDSAEERGRRSVSPPIRELLAKPRARVRVDGLTPPIRPFRMVNQVPLTNGHSVIVTKNTLTPYEKLRLAMQNDRTWAKEVAFGRRIGMYRFRGDVGNGNFSTVKFATHSLTKEKVAIKILDKTKLDAKTQRMLGREIRTMETIHHQHLVRIFEVIETLTKHYLVMELAPGGELFQVISQQGRFAETEAKFYFAQIVSAIDHMHQHNLIHRDIKAENVFFSDPYTIKVGDFGFSTRISGRDELLSTFCGSPPYAAPELFRDESYCGPFVDYWALGVLLHFMVTGHMPFKAQTIVALKRLILECRYDIPVYVSFECCQLIAGFLKKDPTKRYSLEQARSTRWLRDQIQARSSPKYDLKTAFSKLIQERRVTAQLQRHNSVGELLHTAMQAHNETGVVVVSGGGGNADSDNPKRNNRMSLIETKSSNSSSANDSKLLPNTIDADTPIKLTKKQQLSEAERKAFRQLMFLGIDSHIIAENLDRGSLSPIAGTFRILMHRNLQELSKNSLLPSERVNIKVLDRTKSLPSEDQFFQKYSRTKVFAVPLEYRAPSRPRNMLYVSKRKAALAAKQASVPPIPTVPPKPAKESSQESKKKSATLTPTTTSPPLQVAEPPKVKPRKDSVKSDRKSSGTSLSRSWKTMNNLAVVNPNPLPTETSDSNNNQVCIQIEQAAVATPVVEPRQIVHETTMAQIAPTVNQSGCSAGFGWPSSIAKQLKRSQTTPNVSTCHKTNNSGRLTLPGDDGKNRCTIF